MNRKIMPLALLLLAYLTATAFAADTPPPPDVDASAWIKAIYTAVTSKNWGLVVGLGLIALVFPLRKYGPALFKSKLGGLILAFVVSLAGTFGAALAAGAKPDLAMVITALTTAATAAGVWAWLKDHLPGVQAASEKAKVVEPESNAGPFRPAGSLVVLLFAIGLGATQPACPAAMPVVTTAAPIAIDCLAQDQGKLVELVGSLWSAFTSGGSWKDVETIAIANGKELGGCAIAAVVQKYLSPPKGRAAPADGRAARAALEDFRANVAGGATFHTAAGDL